MTDAFGICPVEIDFDTYRRAASEERSATFVARKRLVSFALAFLVATAAFWGTMLTSPPVTEAATPLVVPIEAP